MARRQIIQTIALPPHWDRFVRSNVKSGQYRSASQVVCDGLRLLESCGGGREPSDNELREEIESGWEQSQRGEVVNGPSVFAEIRKISKTRRRAIKSKP